MHTFGRNLGFNPHVHALVPEIKTRGDVCSMVAELNRANFNKVMDLFKDLEYNLSIFSVINKINPGRIFINNMDNPTAALLISPEGMYFTGDAKDNAFNRDLNNVLKDDIFKKALEKSKIDYTAFYSSKEWENSFKVIFNSLYPIEEDRRYLELEIVKFDIVEVSKNVKKIDREMLLDSYLKEIDDVRESIIENWSSIDNFLQNGFGYVYIIDGGVVSRCIADCVVKDRCEVGVETEEDYRKNGYCTQVIIAALNHCKNSNIKSVGWHCWDNNIPSYKLAEKVGFKQKKNIKVYFGWYDLCNNYLINGNYYLKRKVNYKLSAEFYTRAFENNFGFFWQYYNATCAYWKINKKEEAKRYYKIALKNGWKGIETLKLSPIYEYLYDLEDSTMIEAELKI